MQTCKQIYVREIEQFLQSANSLIVTAEATYTPMAVVVEALKNCNRPYICVDAKLSQSVFDVTRQIFAGVFDQLRDSVLRPEKWSTTRPEEALDFLNGRFDSDNR